MLEADKCRVNYCPGSSTSDISALKETNSDKFHKDPPSFPVSAAQREMWLAQKLFPERSFSIAEYAEIDGPLDIDTFSKAITLTVAKTAALQARFAFINEQLVQSFEIPVHEVLSVVDLCASEEALSDAHHWMRKDLAQPRQPEAGDLFIFVLFKLRPDRFIWYQRYQHIIIDGCSLAIIACRVAQIYAALIHEEPIPESEMLEFDLLARHDADYRGSTQFLADKAFWQDYLNRGNEPAWLSLPPDLRADRQKLRATASIAEEDIRRLKHITQAMDARQSHLLIVALGIHFHILTGQTQLNFSLPVSNRSKDEMDTPGMTSNVLPLILQVKSSSYLSNIVQAVAHEVSRILPHQRYRMEEMLRDESMGQTRWFGPTINLIKFDHGPPFAGCQLRWFMPLNDFGRGFHVTFYQPGNGQGLQVFFEDDTAVHTFAELQAHQQLFLSILEAFIHNPDQTVEAVATGCFDRWGHALSGSVFAHRRKPIAAGCLRWRQPAQNLATLVRALDFGNSAPNPLGLPKILLKNRFVCAMRLEVLKQCSGAAPGTLLRIGQNDWEVASGSEDVCIGHFTSLTGEALDAREIAQQEGLSEGDCLPEITDDQANRLMETYQLVRDHESFWSARLARFTPLQFPFAWNHKTSEAPSWQISPWHLPEAFKHFALEERCQYLISVLCVYWARITGETQFQMGWGHNHLANEQPPNFYAQTVPMDVSIDPEANFAEVYENIGEEIARLEKHRTFAMDLVARHIALSAISSLHIPHPWKVAVAVWNGEGDDTSLEAEVHGELATFRINMRDGSFRWHYDASRVSGKQIDRMTGHLLELTQTVMASDVTPVKRLNLLPESERTLLLQTWNETQRDYPADQCLHQLFEQQVERTPHAIALVYEEETLTYAELNARANRLAHELIELGIEPDVQVAICVERSLAMIVGLLAILKAGGAYVPLDPAYPGERLAHILADANPQILLADETGRTTLGEALLSHVVLDPNTLPSQPETNPRLPALTSRHLAYVIYTSGSTGTPKGVMVEHRGLVNLAQAQIARFVVCANSRILQFASFSFDASSSEVVMALGSGASLYLLSDLLFHDRSQLWAYLQQHAITHATLPPALLQGETDEFLQNQALTLILAGEAPNTALLRSLARTNSIFNAYGPTETTVCATTWHCPADYTGEVVPIGRPIANTRIYLLDGCGQPVPLGTVGEIYIGGASVARGYLNQPELTAERFLEDPFAEEAGARMYRSGDLARYLPDGNIEFLGRNDEQVKIRGFRIEPGEIEARLIEHPAVREACVLALGEERNKRLIAYVVTEPDDQLPAILRTFLSRLLPEYMVPTAFVRLDAFPLTPNGKLDRRALPAPDGEAFARRAYEAPIGPIETALAEIWTELLGIDRISRHDSFFELGGHSLLAVRLLERLRCRGLSLAIRDLFQSPTLTMLAQSLSQHREISIPPNRITADTKILTPDLLPLIELSQSEIDRIVACVPGGLSNLQDIYALSPLQDGILFHHLLATKGDPYLLVNQMTFADRATLDRYLNALQQVVSRHDILRTAFVWQGLSNPVQVVWRKAPLSITELSLDPANGPIREQLMQRFNPRQHRIDLTQAPLMRFVLAQDVDSRWVLLQLQHHLICDHSTLEVMYAEVQAFLAGQSERLPIPQPFRNLVAQARLGVSQAEHERFFTDMLAGINTPTLPFGLSEVHRDGTEVEEAHRRLPQALNERLRAQARRLGVSLASLCHLAWAQVLSRTSGQEKVVFGTVLFGRMQAGDGADQAMGLFINTLPLRIDLDHTGVEENVHATHSRLADLLMHEHASLVLAQRCSSLPAGTPLFSALLNYRHNAMPMDKEGSALSEIEFLGGQERTNYPITLAVEDYGQALGLTVRMVRPLDPKRVCGYMEQALTSLVQALEHTPLQPVRELDILPFEERQLLLHTWNETQRDYPADQCIHQLFEEQVERTPQAIALAYEEETLTYSELNAQANRLAHELIELGVQPDELVAICVERSLAMVVGLLAILKTGGAYVPLDPAYPGERLAHILADASPKIVLADETGRTTLGEALLSHVVLDPNTLPSQPETNPRLPALTSHHLAYVIYTSGSTGTPKGVMVEHRGLVNYTNHALHQFDVTTGCGSLILTSLSFDLTLTSFYPPLICGRTIYLSPEGNDAFSWRQHVLNGEHLSPVKLTPSHLDLLQQTLQNDSLDGRIRTLVVGGEPLKGSALIWWRQYAPTTRIFNHYGPTETTVGCIVYEINELPVDTVPIGRPIANTRIYLLDGYGQPVPLGAVGEIYIGGAGVARGYLNRPELTAERFLEDPFAKEPGARMYRSGDLARYLPDGNIEFLGRNDEQVKIRGFRIEPGEIEARLTEHPAVHEACVLALGEESNKRLIAYVVAEEDQELPATLRTFLSSLLPEYMVPTAFVRLDAFPLTPNGKLDRRALPTPDGEAFARRAYEAPIGPIETALAEIWTELLGIDHISRHDSFFELGGHSLLAVRLLERLRRRGLSLAIRDLFQSLTLSVLAQSLSQHRAVSIPPNRITADTKILTPDLLPLIDLTQSDIDRIVAQVPGGLSNLQDIYALSPLQDGILFHHLLATEGDPYLLVHQMAFADRVTLDRYLDAHQQVVDRHDILRTAFVWQGLSNPAQVVWRKAPLSITELNLDPANGPIRKQLMQCFNHHRIDLTQAPLMRFVFAQDVDGRWILVQLRHHLIHDHSTMKVMHAEVRAFLSGQSERLSAPQPFRNLVAQVRLGMSQVEHERFFTDMLAEIDEPTLPFGLSEVHRDGSKVEEARRKLPQSLSERLRAQARRLGVSLASLCHLAWAQVLSRTSGQEKVVFGSVLSGRMQAGEGADQAMGLFINTLPVRLDLDHTGVEQSVRTTHNRLANLLIHEHASLATAQRCSGLPAGTPLFSALFNYWHNTMPTSKADALSGIELLDWQERTNYPLTLSVEDYGQALGLTVLLVQPLDPNRVCDYMEQALTSLVEALDHTPLKPVRELNILPFEERQLLLHTWNKTQTDYPEDQCLHQLFEQQVECTPHAIALVYEEETLTYAELNARANRLAHELIELGIEPDARVAICVERSLAMVVGLLAILKAGGAYVPLDPAYPGERLAHILADANPQIVLADETGRTTLSEALLSHVVLDPNTLPSQPETNPRLPALTSRHLAYVIYTSGSTGTPKGVMVEHAQVVRLFYTTQPAYRFHSNDIWCLFHSFAFDFSVWELWGALLHGGKLLLIPHSVARTPQAFYQLICRQGVTVLNTTPSAFNALMGHAQSSLDRLRYVIFGGEALEMTTLQDWYAARDEYTPQLVNMYGITETTVHATYCALKASDARRTSNLIGKRLPDLRLYLLDGHGQPVPLGVVGELYIGGAGVARGYLNRPELTAERFLEDPFAKEPGARMYRSGDLARYLPDGNIEFLGRNDEQVKIRGFRIEPGEIEARLTEHPAVHEACVLVLGEESNKRLIAYVVAEEDKELPATLRTFLSRLLPEYMVPTAFVRLAAFPLTPNGKLDHRALPAPDGEAFARRAYETPIGPIETALAEIWTELLGIDRISRHDSFFELGGHSLLAVRLLSRITALGTELSLTTLFASPVLHALAHAIKTHLENGGTVVLPPIIPIFHDTFP